jgi:hypothetical protein
MSGATRVLKAELRLGADAPAAPSYEHWRFSEGPPSLSRAQLEHLDPGPGPRPGTWRRVTVAAAAAFSLVARQPPSVTVT